MLYKHQRFADRDDLLRRLPPELRTMAAAAANAVSRARAAEAEAARQRLVVRRLLYQLRAAGLSQRQIGWLVGLSQTRVGELTSAMRD
jgi:hypothetical protein